MWDRFCWVESECCSVLSQVLNAGKVRSWSLVRSDGR